MNRSFYALVLTTLILGSCHKPQCAPPPSDEFVLILEDSTGNNIIAQEYPNLTLELTDINGTHEVHSVDVGDNPPQKAWNFNLNYLISGHPYVLVYDSTHVDTLTVYWELNSTVCNGQTFYSRSLTSAKYNDSTYVHGGLHTYVIP